MPRDARRHSLPAETAREAPSGVRARLVPVLDARQVPLEHRSVAVTTAARGAATEPALRHVQAVNCVGKLMQQRVAHRVPILIATNHDARRVSGVAEVAAIRSCRPPETQRRQRFVRESLRSPHLERQGVQRTRHAPATRDGRTAVGRRGWLPLHAPRRRQRVLTTLGGRLRRSPCLGLRREAPDGTAIDLHDPVTAGRRAHAGPRAAGELGVAEPVQAPGDASTLRGLCFARPVGRAGGHTHSPIRVGVPVEGPHHNTRFGPFSAAPGRNEPPIALSVPSTRAQTRPSATARITRRHPRVGPPHSLRRYSRGSGRHATVSLRRIPSDGWVRESAERCRCGRGAWSNQCPSRVCQPSPGTSSTAG